MPGKKTPVEKAAKKMQRLNSKLVKKAKKAESKAKDVYKRAKNGRVYKLVNGRPRFVSKAEASENGFDSK